MAQMTYTCLVCGNEVKVEKGKPVPLCCMKDMEPLPFCTTAPNAEMARNNNEDLPCDDGTHSKKK